MSIDLTLRLPRDEFMLDVDLSLPGQGVTAIFGRSGSGKTTLLRCLAGLESLGTGDLTVNGQRWQQGSECLPTHQRRLGYVFQEASLFAHRTVRGNLEYGFRRTPVSERRLTVDEVVGWLGLSELLNRAPAELSGGQRQRVAVARALLTSPDLLLMDEPLASLDSASKAEILPYLERLSARLSIPILYVSHAIEEVARLADHLLLLENGTCTAHGPLQDMLTRTDLPLAHADNAVALLKAGVLDYDSDYHLVTLALNGAQIRVPSLTRPATETARIRVAARDVMLSLEPPSGLSAQNAVPATITEIATEPHPAFRIIRLQLGDQPMLARLTRRAVDALDLQVGQSVHAVFKTVSLV